VKGSGRCGGVARQVAVKIQGPPFDKYCGVNRERKPRAFIKRGLPTLSEIEENGLKSCSFIKIKRTPQKSFGSAGKPVSAPKRFRTSLSNHE
jgi:hypothetical protein